MEKNIWNKISAGLLAIIIKKKKKEPGFQNISVVVPGVVPLLGVFQCKFCFRRKFCEIEHDVAEFTNKRTLVYFYLLFLVYFYLLFSVYFYCHNYGSSELCICNIQTFSSLELCLAAEVPQIFDWYLHSCHSWGKDLGKW